MLSLILTLLLAGDAQAQGTLKTAVYQTEEEKDEAKSFTAKVRLIREESDGVDVFFEGEKAKGTYFLSQSLEHYGKMMADLEKSRKPQGPAVSVEADKDKRIKKVELAKQPESDFKIPDDPNQKWDFGKPPE